MINVKSDFIGDFKLGDNLNHNLRILSSLYSAQQEAAEDEREILCKPIIVFLASICEAVLGDLHMRIREFTQEGVSNVDKAVCDHVRAKKIDEFGKYIDSVKKHGFFGSTEEGLYDALHTLRKLRNRIHIQNDKNNFERDEYEVYTLGRQEEAEQAVEKVFRLMEEKYSRSGYPIGYVDDFVLPWSPGNPPKN